METNLILLSLVFFIIAFMVGVKKQTWIMAGFNEKRVKDKNKLAKIAGLYLFLPLGLFLLISAFIDYPYQDKVLPIGSIAYGLIIIFYVNEKMVE
ncbi:DUF3784 domain-containing protein [Fictibacillus barbaricus]|uniref:DUF3784 domain-containing protein n=1 Tax=Fictibacillus barbaricus TaxID=182136 RepID=A0ABS2ZBY2_9BACL|nr:DUF3784 domain-containing protein [Fictibacillus barbaricus]MBN3544941.1 DUF3784 domain-containing protein [Fictibacillus barbaricus]GGB62926.1 hypothetical protein GCM10007199_31140 [Fictibacillus barbaricus]